MKVKTLSTLLFLVTPLIWAVDPPKGDAKSAPWDGSETVAAYAKRTGWEPVLTLDVGGGVKWEGVLIPAGSFIMGSPAGEAKTEAESAMEKQHKVTITRPFYMGKYELTQAQYLRVMGDNPSPNKNDDLPVHNVSWANAQDFCNKLGKLTHHEVRLPTEAEWEYACRAGTTTPYYNGSQISDLEKIAWFGGNSEHKLHPCGQKLPNAWGLYDMLGNIREFVQDWYVAAPLEDGIDPTGPKEGDARNHVVRGGAYTANAAGALNCRAATRRGTEALVITGFRIMVATPEAK